jgi:hypothetical protein
MSSNNVFQVPDQVFIKVVSKATNIKQALSELGLIPKGETIKRFEISTWKDKPLSLHLDHINGCRTDNRLNNLRLLCPNCHSQTDTYCGRNKGKTNP